MGMFIWVGKTSNFILDAWNDIFWVNGRCWGRAYVWRKHESTTPPPPTGDQAFVVSVPCLYQYIAVLYKASD